MKIIFLGTGEAFDENIPNNSHLVVSQQAKLLLDCGLTSPTQVWKYNDDSSLLDAVYISHQHADHFFGLPALLMRMWEGGRKKNFTIICQKELKDNFGSFMDLAYKDFQKKFKFKIDLIESLEGKNLKFKNLHLSFEKTVHSGKNLAIKISDNVSAIAYSGDGSPKDGSDFYKNLDLLISETYLYDKEIIGHSSILSSVAFAEKNSIKCLALTHINRDFRRNELPKIKNKIKSNKTKILIPNPLDKYIF